MLWQKCMTLLLVNCLLAALLDKTGTGERKNRARTLMLIVVSFDLVKSVRQKPQSKLNVHPLRWLVSFGRVVSKFDDVSIHLCELAKPTIVTRLTVQKMNRIALESNHKTTTEEEMSIQIFSSIRFAFEFDFCCC